MLLVLWINENGLWNVGYNEMGSRMIGLEVGVMSLCGLWIRSVINCDMNWCRPLGCSKYKGDSAEIWYKYCWFTRIISNTQDYGLIKNLEFHKDL
jgi:hypothetical protein